MVKILVVEDDASVREMLVRRLGRSGFQVIAAINGVQAIAIAQTERPKLILLDLGLPILDGWQTAERLRANPETCAIPIIVLSGYGDPLDRNQLPAGTYDDFEPKPINFSRLFAKISMLANLDQGDILRKREV
jgi:CheY-like chemotaxis protein